MIDSIKIEKQLRDRKYYDQFGYVAKFLLPEVSALRYNLDHDHIDQQLDYREHYRQINWGGSWQHIGKPITNDVRSNCHKFCDFLLSRSLNYKFLIFDTHIGHYYTDVLDEINKLTTLSYIKVLNVKQALVDLPRNSIKLKKSDYKYRTYFSNQHLSSEQKNNLTNFLVSRTDVRLSPSLTEYISKSHKYICDNFFVDHNDSGFLTFLTLVSSIKIKKTVDIICDK